MNTNEPVDGAIRLAISQWPDDAPRGAVTTFCLEAGISRKTFYLLRARAKQEGQASILEPRSRRPATSPTTITEKAIGQALDVRGALERSGLDYGPISVHDKMITMGLDAPSIASLARIFRAHGVARDQPKKRPRASYRRFVYPAPNACWQLDATEYVLSRGRACVIFQLEDDHARLEVASHVAWTENSADAVIVFKKGIAAYGVPQRLLTDNGTALNPSRRGWIGQLTAYANSLGVETITGKPYTPTTQGKNERLHQTLFQWLNKQPQAESLAELQALVDQFDIIYNTQRPHQGLPGRITPQQAWDATPVADPPRPRAPIVARIVPDAAHIAATTPSQPPLWKGFPDTGTREAIVNRDGTVSFNRITFQIGRAYRDQTIHAVWNTTGIAFITIDSQLIIEHPWPPPETRYVGNGKPRGRHPTT